MAFVTIRATDANVSKKGEVTRIKDVADYGTGSRLPRSLRVEVTNATAAQIEEWLLRLRDHLAYTVITENAAGWRVRMEIDPAVVAATGMSKAFKLSLRDWVLDDPHNGNWQAIFFSQTIDELVCDIAKGQAYGLPEIKTDVDLYYLDLYTEVQGYRNYYFPDSIIDPAVTQGLIDEAANELPNGDLPSDWVHDSNTHQQMQSVIVDRLVP